MNHMLKRGDGALIACAVDDYTDPWTTPETILLIHGLAESMEAWRAWVPALARRYRVLRMDNRGFGRSSPMPEDFAWSLDVLAGDIAAVVNELDAGPVHVVGAKIGATISARFAATHPRLARTLTLIGLPVKGPKAESAVRTVVEGGIRAWARATMDERLGSTAPPEMLEWWSDLMARTPLSTMAGFMRAVGGFSVAADLPKLACPVLALTSDSKLHPVREAETWRATIRESEISIVPGDGYHAAASHPDVCAAAVLDFIGRRGRREK